jgi:hypothetical protein
VQNPLDKQIAATALMYGLTLVTRADRDWTDRIDSRSVALAVKESAPDQSISSALRRHGFCNAHLRSDPEGQYDRPQTDLIPIGKAARGRNPASVQMSSVLATNILQGRLAMRDDNPRMVSRYTWGVDRNRGVGGTTDHVRSFKQWDVTSLEGEP